nr:flagellin [Alishewanella tabrizica]
MDISTFESAALSVQSIDVGLSQLGFQQSSIGAIENRLASTIRNITNTSENVSTARSRIRDTDFAKETAELTRLQIVTQAASSLLSQANLRPNQVLSLLTR